MFRQYFNFNTYFSITCYKTLASNPKMRPSFTSSSPFPPGKKPGPGADLRQLHLQLLPGCSPQLLCLLGPDAGLLPPSPGESVHLGSASHRRPGAGTAGRPAGGGVAGAVHTVSSLSEQGLREPLRQDYIRTCLV